jgi:hypothetical protein
MFEARTITQVSTTPSPVDTRYTTNLPSLDLLDIAYTLLYINDSNLVSPMAPANRNDPQTQKQALIKALNEHRINTIVELRRVERIFATLGSSDVTQPMTAACMHFSFQVV